MGLIADNVTDFILFAFFGMDVNLELILLICLSPIFLCMLAFILSSWVGDFLNRKKKTDTKKPDTPKPEIKPPAQKPTKIMTQNTAREYRMVEISQVQDQQTKSLMRHSLIQWQTKNQFTIL